MKTGMVALLTLMGLGLTACSNPPAPAPEGMLGARDFRQVVRQAKESVFPAVVYVKCFNSVSCIFEYFIHINTNFYNNNK